ncbi:MAG: hypothetical protein V4563_14925 [Pseudomonadota bacterium]
MTITNHAGLPLPLVEAVRRDPYHSNGSDTTATTLLKPARAVALEKLHKAEITEDAADRLWALIGQIGHLILERSGGMLTELRLFAEVRGWKVSGQMDLLSGNILTDYKLTSVWSCKDGLKPEWEQQLNALRLLASMNGHKIEKAQIVAIYRDWSKLEARRSADYPRHQVQVFDVPLWNLLDAMKWLDERVQVHQAAQSALEKNLPECTASERWEKPTKYALMKTGRERAVRLYDDRTQAVLAAEGNSALRVEERPGSQTRCESYCNARPWCSQADALGVPKE